MLEQSRDSPVLEILITRSLPVRVPTLTHVLDGDEEDVEEAQEHVAREPEVEWHGGALAIDAVRTAAATTTKARFKSMLSTTGLE